jgi:hypothetical protein
MGSGDLNPSSVVAQVVSFCNIACPEPDVSLSTGFRTSASGVLALLVLLVVVVATGALLAPAGTHSAFWLYNTINAVQLTFHTGIKICIRDV